jgi:hypothetical protein
MTPELPAPIRRGRPPGSKNKPKKRLLRPIPKAEEGGFTKIYIRNGESSPLEPLATNRPQISRKFPANFPQTAPPDHPKGYTRIYVDDAGQELAKPLDEPTPVKAPAPAAEPLQVLEVSMASDAEQRKMIDEFGELDRIMKLHEAKRARYEFLKRLIKSWFDQAPADADGAVEGEVYRLHLSARERERRIRDMRELVDRIGLDKVLELASVSLSALEDLLGKTGVSALTVEARIGSRRIRAVPKFPAGLPS